MNLRRLFIGFFLASALFVGAQEDTKSFVFETLAEVKASPVKDQAKSGTCWAFAAVAFLESELLRMDKGEYDLSEMFFVNHAYRDKGIRYIRMHGALNYGPGGQAHDVINTLKTQGMITEAAYSGLKADEEKHNHAEMDAVLRGFLDALKRNPAKTYTINWITAYNSIIDAYLGPIPATFTHAGKSQTPATLFKESGLNPDDYIEITSYTHHPFYTLINLEIPDNWSGGMYYNLPLADLLKIIEHALRNGYSVAWDGDVSDKGFSHKHGVAVLPAEKADDLSGSERARWESLSTAERSKLMYSFEGPVAERNISQEDRQRAFDNHTATDDHLMHFTALVKDQNGTLYFKTKNSWGTDNNPYGGYLYMSEQFVRQNTIAIMIHKKALPKEIAKKLGL